MSDIIYKVNDLFVKHIAEYSNGILTTCGFYKKTELEPVNYPVFRIAYNSDACTELPLDWFSMVWIDDRNENHKIVRIDFASIGNGPVYIMDDGYKSQEVIG